VPGTGLLLVDLDRFKEVNDRHGHHVGDAWLVEVAKRLRDVTRREDFVARIGGDEFAVVPSSPLDDAALDELARRLIDRLRAPCRLQGREVAGSASVGAARLAEARGDGVSLFARADAALYAAKRRGGGYELAAPAAGEMDNPVVRRADRQHPA
jgi:diguanylate cyclase (GGDEF)-like protein